MAEMLIAAILGLVEGLTEFIPVSSTGHLILASHLLGFDDQMSQEIASGFKIFIQLGAVLAVVVAYPRRFAGLLSLRDNRGFSGLRGLGLLALTTTPAALVALAAHDLITKRLYGPIPVAIGLFAGGVWILVMEWLRRRPRREGLDTLTWTDALAVGLFQCLSLWPGVSRAAATILGGMAIGIDRRTATEYSFFAAVAIIPAAALYELVKIREHLSLSHVPLFAVGTLVSFLFGWLAVKFFVRYLSRHTLTLFGWYRLVLALLVIWKLGGFHSL